MVYKNRIVSCGNLRKYKELLREAHVFVLMSRNDDTVSILVFGNRAQMDFVYLLQLAQF